MQKCKLEKHIYGVHGGTPPSDSTKVSIGESLTKRFLVIGESLLTNKFCYNGESMTNFFGEKGETRLSLEGGKVKITIDPCIKPTLDLQLGAPT